MKHYTLDRQALAALLEASGLNQSQLAAQIGVSQPAVSQFMSGAAQPSAETAHKIAAALGVDFAAIVTGGRRDIAAVAPALQAKAS